jgi:uncharacterized protein (TIGR02996 family)
VGGALWSVWRSVRGIETTYRLLEYARWSHEGASLLWRSHLREGIADDGSPTGIEHAFRLESFEPNIFVLWSRWRDCRGALRLRELGRDEKVDRLVNITHDMMFRYRSKPVRARAFDLDVLHELARDATDIATLAESWQNNISCAEIAVPRFFPTECHVAPYSRALSEQVAAQRAACTGHEREFLEQIEAAPHEIGSLLVYADWLETTGRHDDAVVVRARLP